MNIVTQGKICFIVLADSQGHLEDLGGLGHRAESGSFVITHLLITSDWSQIIMRSTKLGGLWACPHRKNGCSDIEFGGISESIYLYFYKYWFEEAIKFYTQSHTTSFSYIAIAI